MPATRSIDRVRRSLLVAAALAALPLAGCSRGDEDPSAIAADDQRQLNEAAAMLESNGIDVNTPTESPAHD